MDIRNTRQLKDFSAGRLANAREGQKIILYFSLITIAVSAVATVVSYILSQQPRPAALEAWASAPL